MPLINCPVCGHAISADAEACPECGHPNRPALAERPGPTCYACSATATTRCQKCGALSCVEHVRNIYVPHGQGGANELRCATCYADGKFWQAVMASLVVVVLVIGAIAFMIATH